MVGWAIAVHGGAGVDPNLPPHRQEEAKQLLTHCLNVGISALRSNGSAVDVVELVVRRSFPSIFLILPNIYNHVCFSYNHVIYTKYMYMYGQCKTLKPSR
jgi:hypothetical protein